MFLNCLHCGALVATDPVTGLAPDHCPYCDGLLVGADALDEGDGKAPPATALPDTAGDVPGGALPDSALAPVGTGAADALGEPGSGMQTPANAGSSPDAQPPVAATRARKQRVQPSFARQRARDANPRRARWPWPVAAALALLLALQLLVADRASLAASPRWRATISATCEFLRCDIPPWREVEAFRMLSRDVRAHPGTPDALRVRAAFRNDARWAQPWPDLVLTLSDASGRVTGSRSFSAVEYMGGTPTQKLIATGQTASFVLDVMEPAPDTVSFSFDFR